MRTVKHELPYEDRMLFSSMAGKYHSANEENFFKNMQYKQEYQPTALNDLIVSEYENEDEIYVVRMYNDEYIVGQGINTDGANEEHFMCLSDALAFRLSVLGFADKNITLWDWLRRCDYNVVNYERNYDIIENGKRR